MRKGRVFLVGAGPGDTQLITIKGLEAIKQAEVILYDRLANPKLLEQAPAHCEFIYCGKLPDRHIIRQEQINELLVEKAMEGKIVVRLKGGDPGVFGRVGEEAEALALQEIEYDIVPGITSGLAAPLYAGIPVTHREFGESFAVITAHDKSKEGMPLLDWNALATGLDTIAFYMGIANLPTICQNLIKHGKPAETPVILIQWGTFGRQKTLEGTLATIAKKAADIKFSNPAITLVGDIVSVRKKINWFEKKPLFGRQILLARTGTKESEIARDLSALGADVFEFPKWKKTKIPANQAILSDIGKYEQILFTSPESVEDFFLQLKELQTDIRQVKAKIFGASKKSVMALSEKGLMALLAEELSDSQSLLLVGDNRHEKHGSMHYFTTSNYEIDKKYDFVLKLMFIEAKIDTIIFPSSQSIQSLIQEAERTELFTKEELIDSNIVCMGQKTWQTAAELGLKPNLMPKKPTIQSVIDCLVEAGVVK